MVKTAVILAAGMGSRLGERTKHQPKGFLQLGEKPIIEESIQKLLEAGIEEIVIGTGYLAEAYEELAKQYPQITCVRNDKYETTGSLYTLYCLKERVSQDFLLLESDLVYEKKAIKLLINHRCADVILASSLTGANDEVFIETDEQCLLKKMSKNKEELVNPSVALVGISKLSHSTFHAICEYAEKHFQEQMMLDYEAALVGISSQVPLYVYKIHPLAWCEIDNEEHLLQAKRDIYPYIKLQEREKPPVQRKILLNPGPATTTDTVKYAQVVPDICPREEEFGYVMQFISDELTNFVASTDQYTTVLFGGSGTAVVESILSSVIGDGTVLIINNGAYGKRMCQIADVYGLNFVEFESRPDQPLHLPSIEKIIHQSNGKITHLAVVHHETTTGLLNDIASLGRLCQTYGIHMIVDAMSSYAAIPLDMEAMNISYLAASSNKNLQGMAGVGFVIARKDHLEATKQLRPRNFYLHLYSQYQYFQETKQMRFTPPVQTLYALKQAIIETRLEGIENRYARYSKIWEVLINGITRLGLTHLVKKEHHSRIITAIVEPTIPSYCFGEMHQFFQQHGITIYPGKLHDFPTFRVANIGDITYKDMEQFVQLLEQYLFSIGFCPERKKNHGIS
jgi:2-aminoethylphosphonate-pyruvate transaminase